mgnify:CR=1 FL=1
MKILSYISFVFILLYSCKKLDIRQVSKVDLKDLSIVNTYVIINNTLVDYPPGEQIYYGNCWALGKIPTIDDERSSYGPNVAIGSYSDTLFGLKANMSYYIRPYVFDGINVTYGLLDSFATTTNGLEVVIDPAIIVDEETVNINLNVSNFGSLGSLDFGICYSDSGLPDMNSEKSSIGSIQVDYSETRSITGLSVGTTYFFRAYLQLDSNLVIYSNTIQETITEILVETGSYNGGGTSIDLYGSITSLGINAIIDHGHCYSYTSSNPDMNSILNSLGPKSSVGNYTSNLSGLTPGLTYYYRAYAYDGEKVVYGEVKSFTL